MRIDSIVYVLDSALKQLKYAIVRAVYYDYG